MAIMQADPQNIFDLYYFATRIGLSCSRNYVEKHKSAQLPGFQITTMRKCSKQIATLPGSGSACSG